MFNYINNCRFCGEEFLTNTKDNNHYCTHQCAWQAQLQADFAALKKGQDPKAKIKIKIK